MKKGLIALATLVVGTFVAVVAHSAFFPPPPDINMADYNAIGDGVTVNNTQFQSALTRVANGGKIYIPCGTYKITQALAVTVASGKHIEFVGGGSDCTILFISGAFDGPTFTYASQWSSVRVSHLSLTTDQVGTQRGLSFVGTFVNSNPALAAINSVDDVLYRGSDAYSAATKYWNNGFHDNSVSNVNITGGGYLGIPALAGTAIDLAGSGNGDTFAVQINITYFTTDNCATSVLYGDWVQGVDISLVNFTGCNNGVIVAGSRAGFGGGLLVANSQIASFACGICVNDPAFPNTQLINNQMIVFHNAIGVKVQGSNWLISNNEFNANVHQGDSPSANGIIVAASFGNGGSIIGNHIEEFATAIQINSASQADTQIDANHFVGNTADYGINATSRGTVINDTHHRNYATVPACNAATAFSHYLVDNLTVSTFNATVTTGGGNVFVGMKCDGSRNYVD